MSEKSCADAIEPHLTALYRPELEGRSEWAVCVGSHGGSGKTLIKAMRSCLMCCGLGEWWRVEYGKGDLLRSVFDRAALEHLGRPLFADAAARR